MSTNLGKTITALEALKALEEGSVLRRVDANGNPRKYLRKRDGSIMVAASFEDVSNNRWEHVQTDAATFFESSYLILSGSQASNYDVQLYAKSMKVTDAIKEMSSHAVQRFGVNGAKGQFFRMSNGEIQVADTPQDYIDGKWSRARTDIGSFVNSTFKRVKSVKAIDVSPVYAA